MSDGGPNSKRRKTGKFYKKQQYRNQGRQKFLEPGLRGFMITCNYREKDCVRECYNLLNEYAEPIVEKEEPKEENTIPKKDANAGDGIQLAAIDNGSVLVANTESVHINADGAESGNGLTSDKEAEIIQNPVDKKAEENSDQTETKEKPDEHTAKVVETESTTVKNDDEANMDVEHDADNGVQSAATDNGLVLVSKTESGVENGNGLTSNKEVEITQNQKDKTVEENSDQAENKERPDENTAKVDETESTTIKNDVESNKDVEDDSNETEDSDEEDEEEDISTQLENQIKSLNDPKKINRNRFKQVDTKTMNCIFINCSVDDPMELGLKIVRDIATTRVQKSRFILRFLPIEAVCKATLDDIKNAAGKLFDKYLLNTTPKTFSIVVNKRLNNSVERMKIIRELAEMITFKNVLHKVNLKNPQYSVVVEINKGLCCLTVLPDYMQLKKYNLSELIKTENGNGTESTASNQASVACS